MVSPVADTPSNLPPFVTWPSFPFEGHLQIKRLDPPVATEPPREGEDPSTCTACHASDDSYIWVSDRWRVRAMDRPSGLPMVLILESRSHLDLGDLTNLLAAELGVMTVRLERAVRSLEGVERVHVNRWGDGAAHLHVWFLARPTGQLQLRGSFLSLWDEILEPIPETRWREDIAHVAAWLADFGGRAVAEPPRIEWHTPSSFGDVMAYKADDSTSVGASASVIADAADVGEGTGQGHALEVATAVGVAGDGAQGDAADDEDIPAEDGAPAVAASDDPASNVGENVADVAAQTSVEAATSEQPNAVNGARVNGAQANADTDDRNDETLVAAQNVDGDLDGEGWTLSDDEIATSDILSH